jgi:hypothetical protein
MRPSALTRKRAIDRRVATLADGALPMPPEPASLARDGACSRATPV